MFYGWLLSILSVSIDLSMDDAGTKSPVNMVLVPGMTSVLYVATTHVEVTDLAILNFVQKLHVKHWGRNISLMLCF